MSDEHPTFAVRSDRGLVRESNQDQGYAGSRLLAVADGFGPQPGTDLVSAVAIDALRPLDSPDVARAHSVLDVLQDAVRDAGAAVREFVSSDPARHGGGTTLTAMLWSGSRLALVHVGDSRVQRSVLIRAPHDGAHAPPDVQLRVTCGPATGTCCAPTGCTPSSRRRL